MKFVLWVIGHAIALGVAVWLVPGITLTGPNRVHHVITLLIVGVIFGLVTAIVKPVITLLTLPFIILTLGLLLLVINALMLMLTAALSGALGLGFHVHGFWTAVLGGLIISIASMVVEALLPDRRKRRPARRPRERSGRW